MLKTTTRILLFGLFMFAQAGFAHADQQWVTVDVLNGTTSSEYEGLMDSSAFDQVSKKLDDKAMVQLSSVFWIDGDGKVAQIKDLQVKGTKYGFTDTIYLREDSITRIVTLDKAYIESLLPKAPGK